MRIHPRAAMICAALLAFPTAQAAPPFNVELSPGIVKRQSVTDDLAFGRQVALTLQNGRLIAVWADNSVPDRRIRSRPGCAANDRQRLRELAGRSCQQNSAVSSETTLGGIGRRDLRRPDGECVVSDETGTPAGTTGTATLGEPSSERSQHGRQSGAAITPSSGPAQQ